MASEETNQPSTFTIGGAEYEIPVIATFDMDEAEILWRYCQLGLEDLVPDSDGTWSEERNDEILTHLKNPSFRKTLLHVAYRRSNPDASAKEIEKQIGKVSNLEALAAWMGQFSGDDDNPPAQESTNKPEPLSNSETVDSNSISGNGSPKTSVQPDDLPEPTGATR
jgi:hypothetical protein